MIQSDKIDSYMNIKKTANLLLNFAVKRLAEFFGIIIFAAGAFLLIALITYSPEDPNFIFPNNTEIKNLLGFQGSFVSDIFFQSVGVISYLISLTFIFTGVNIFRLKDFFLLIENFFFTSIYSIFGSLFFNYYYFNTFTLYINGNGGFVGNYLNQTFLSSLIQIHETTSFYILILVTFGFGVSGLLSLNLCVFSKSPSIDSNSVRSKSFRVVLLSSGMPSHRG